VDNYNIATFLVKLCTDHKI